MSTIDSLQTFKYSDKETSSFLNNISDLDKDKDGSYSLVVLAGKHNSAKKDFRNKVKKQVGDQFKEFDLREIISTDLDESKEKIDLLFSSLESEKYIWLKNGDQLGGVYTGYSYSVQRYATPQERYLINKIAESGKVFFLDLADIHTVNNLMRRNAQLLITFEYPSSLLGRLKQITVHGHSFSSNRRALS